jgi:hyperosmotically inducible periplasmic protein
MDNPTTPARGDATTLLRHRHYPRQVHPARPAGDASHPPRAAKLARSRHLITAAALLLGVAGLLALAGCSRDAPERTAGERLDTAVEKTEEKLGEARQSVEDAAKATGTAITDTAITAAVKTQLAGDADLKMLDIQVETQSGHTVLQGRVPDESARDRATRIASAVTGVSAVDNRLEVRP